MDYLIKILVEDIEPDFRQTHIHCGIGFKGRQLCKAEQDAKKTTNAIPYEEAEVVICEADNNEVFSFHLLSTIIHSLCSDSSHLVHH